MTDRLSSLIERGALSEALAALAQGQGRPWRVLIDFNMEFDPRQDLLYEGSAQDPKSYESALSLIRRARRAAPDSAGLWVLEGAVHFAFKRFGLAMRSFDRALAMGPSFPWARLWRFRALAYQAMTVKSPFLLEEAVQLSETLSPSFFLHAWRAELYTGFDLHDKALADLDETLRLKPDYSWAYAEKADIFTQQHRLEPALACCERLISLHPGEGWAYALRSRAWGKCGRLNEALADLDRAVFLSPDLGSIYSWRGECRRHGGDLVGAVADFDRAEALDPSYPLTYLWRGAAWLKLGRLKEAARDLSRSLRRDPRNLLARAWRGEAFARLGRFREAAEDFDAFHPSSPRETWTAGPAAIWEDLDELAHRHFRSPWARALRGRFLLENPTVPPQRPLEDLDAAVRALPREAWCLAWRAQALERLGRSSEALRDLNAAVALCPRWVWAWAWRGRLKAGKGDHRGALADLDRALRLDAAVGELYAWRAAIARQPGRDAGRDRERAAALGYKESLAAAAGAAA